MATLPGRDVVVAAASAGGLAPLRILLGGLPADLPASVLVVLHISSSGGRSLPHILDRAGPLHAATAVDGEKLQPGRVYVAPPDRHLLIVKDQVRLSRGPRQNGLRPAADPLFRSAALYCGPRATAVVLSGALDDASLGCATVERNGGFVAVQSPEEAEYDGMPRSALAATEHAVAKPVGELPKLIARLAREEVEMQPQQPAPDLEAEIKGLLAGDPETNTATRYFTEFTCPDCGGPLYYSEEDKAASYDCLVGHRWSPQSLLQEQSAAVERALWLAIRSLDERGRLVERLAEAAEQRGHRHSARRFGDAAVEAWQAADAIRKLASGMTAVPDEFGDAEPGPEDASRRPS